MYDQEKNKKIPSDTYAFMRELLEEEGLTEYSNLNIEFFAKYGHLSDAMVKTIKKGELTAFYNFMSKRLTGEASQALEYFKEFFTSNKDNLGLSESLRDWFKKEKWVRINTSGNIAGPCGTSKNKKNPDRCLPAAKARSLTKAQRAATAQKKKKAGAKGETIVKNTEKATVRKESIQTWPKTITSRYSDEYEFRLIKVMSDRAKYEVVDLESGKVKGTQVYKSPDSLKAAAADLIKPQGGRQSSQFESAKNKKVPLDFSMLDEEVNIGDLDNAVYRLENVYKYLDIEYKETIRGEKYVQINYIPVTSPQSQNPEFVNVRYNNDEDLEIIKNRLDFPIELTEGEINEEAKKKLNKPMRDSSGGKAYKVYVKDPKTKKIKTVRFGSGGLRAKINDKKARNAFAKRHKCSTKKDKTKAGYWSCRLPRYAKLLGLKSNFGGFW